MSDTEAVAKAVEESAKLGQEVIRNAGAAERIVSGIMGPFGEAYGLATDLARHAREEINWRINNKKIIAQLTFQKLVARQLDAAEVKPIPPRIAYDYAEKIELEDDPCLQDLWANLIVNSADPNSGVEPTRIFGRLLGDLEAGDAAVLNELSLRMSTVRGYFIIAGNPEGTATQVSALLTYAATHEGKKPPSTPAMEYEEAYEAFQMAWGIADLHRIIDRLDSLGLVRWTKEALMAQELFETEAAFTGASQMELLRAAVNASTGDIDVFSITDLGEAFIAAVSAPRPAGPLSPPP